MRLFKPIIDRVYCTSFYLNILTIVNMWYIDLMLNKKMAYQIGYIVSFDMNFDILAKKYIYIHSALSYFKLNRYINIRILSSIT